MYKWIFVGFDGSLSVCFVLNEVIWIVMVFGGEVICVYVVEYWLQFVDVDVGFVVECDGDVVVVDVVMLVFDDVKVVFVWQYVCGMVCVFDVYGEDIVMVLMCMVVEVDVDLIVMGMSG